MYICLSIYTCIYIYIYVFIIGLRRGGPGPLAGGGNAAATGVQGSYRTILYYTIPYHTLLYSTLLYSTLLYYTIIYYTILYHTIPYSTLLYSTLLYYTIRYCLRGVHRGCMRGMREATGGFRASLGCYDNIITKYLYIYIYITRRRSRRRIGIEGTWESHALDQEVARGSSGIAGDCGVSLSRCVLIVLIHSRLLSTTLTL